MKSATSSAQAADPKPTNAYLAAVDWDALGAFLDSRRNKAA